MNSLNKFLLILYIIALTCFYGLLMLMPLNYVNYNRALQFLNNLYGVYKWYYFIILLLLIIINMYFIISIFIGSRSPKIGVLKSMPEGDMYISNETIKSLVLKTIEQTKGIKDAKVFVKPGKDNMNILIKALVVPDINIPSTIKNVQENVKNYIENIAEIPVGEIKVVIEDIAQNTKLRFE
ncbi:alkaline shock response membrane anchor protein AmaP [Caloramator sp. E03]|uniref:alkaline shock response membrane anchor protein AmaP n=1 Tax=Caloramator sp. E03 TaxID=2576307 RepID=UPI0011105E2E|nr:alkaline shock response membrane anchor protein AmaP [Caloramator sp. E03]QCX32699.1 alkaline shock response membrane anchor protein AmaP [Caloramator sp. E03]